jgi:hypothetical protein
VIRPQSITGRPPTFNECLNKLAEKLGLINNIMGKLEIEYCKLCNKNSPVDSHIIPKFVIRWKNKTGTGRMRHAINPNVPTQDGIVEKFLCGDCERKFNRAETYFANKVFFPIVDKSAAIIEYDNNFKYFIISVLWRVLKHSLIDDVKDSVWHSTALAVEKEWADFLYFDKPIQTFDEIHLLVGVDIIKEGDIVIENETNKEFIRYMGRTIDSGIPYNDKTCLIYLKLPRFLFMVPLVGIDLGSFHNSKIYDKGTYDANSVVINEPLISDFLLNRITQIKKAKESISDIQKNKSLDLFLKKQSEISEKDLGIINKYIEKINNPSAHGHKI